MESKEGCLLVNINQEFTWGPYRKDTLAVETS